MSKATLPEQTEQIIDGRRLEIALWPQTGTRTPIVLAHEGLGSVSMWRDFPADLAAATGRTVYAYSRYGYGKSDSLREARTVDYMHHEARVVLPPLLDALGLATTVLFGHSDGASIALLFAAAYPSRTRALVLEAPHVFVEPLTLTSIAAARDAANTTDLLARLARYHVDAASTFWGWNDIWLLPDFAAWNITGVLPSIAAPTLLVQGNDDEYGTAAQIAAIELAIPAATSLFLDACGHSPHRAQPAVVLERTRTFLEPLP